MEQGERAGESQAKEGQRGRGARTIGRLLIALTFILLVSLPSAAYAEGVCPNEALRAESHSTALPECRAYELVTPPYKEGWPVLGVAPIVEGPEGVVRAEGESFGVFAGAERDGLNARYEFTRTPTGWTTSALEVPASLYNYAESGSSKDSADLTRELWLLPLHPPAEEPPRDRELGFYVREAGGEFAFVGPFLSPASTGAEGAIVRQPGASSDLSHVLVGVEALPGSLWPGDETEVTGPLLFGRWSLYEYSGTGNSEPALVGVENKEALHGSPALNDGAQLISECGTELGSGDAKSMYNAISSDGSMVYFTAQHSASCAARQPAVNQLYARVDGERTLAISEPPLTLPGRQCTGTCESDEMTDRREGIFQGASQDGKRAFFLSEQPLVNADGDTTMDLYMAEIAGEGAGAHIDRLAMISEGDESDPHRGEGAQVQGVARVSENGERVYFVAKDALTTRPDLSLPAGRQTAVEGQDNLFVYDAVTGRIAFVATLSSGDGADWELKDLRPVQSTEDGEYLLFSSSADLTEGDTSTAPQLFEYDAASETLARVSIGQEGFNEDGNVNDSAFSPSIEAPLDDADDSPVAAEDGLDLARDGAVFFNSADGLTQRALNRVLAGLGPEGEQVWANNVYEYREGHVYLISDGRDTAQISGSSSTVSLSGITPSGDDVFFSTADPLVAQDTDTQVDVYDARVDGGFPAPAPSDLCGEGDCRAASGAPPQLPLSGGSETAAAGDNLAAPVESKPAPKPLTRAQKLANALKACKRDKARKKRAACESVARKRYGRAAKATKTSRGSR